MTIPPPLRTQAEAALDALPKAFESNAHLRAALIAIAQLEGKQIADGTKWRIAKAIVFRCLNGQPEGD